MITFPLWYCCQYNYNYNSATPFTAFRLLVLPGVLLPSHLFLPHFKPGFNAFMVNTDDRIRLGPYWCMWKMSSQILLGLSKKRTWSPRMWGKHLTPSLIEKKPINRWASKPFQIKFNFGFFSFFIFSCFCWASSSKPQLKCSILHFLKFLHFFVFFLGSWILTVFKKLLGEDNFISKEFKVFELGPIAPTVVGLSLLHGNDFVACNKTPTNIFWFIRE